MKKLIIGPSTGWLYTRKIYSLAKQKTFLETVRANAVEIFLAKWDRDDKRMLSLKEEPFDVKSFVFRSVHIPNIDSQKDQLAITQEVIALCGATVALTHPQKVNGAYPVRNYERMISNNVPLAIENMDSRKNSGFDLAELEKLVKDTGCKFVLDVQHAYEHDHKMIYAHDLLESLKHQLVYVHLSGETKNNIHSLVYKAENAETIIEFIRNALFIKNVPLILEGEYTNSDEIRREIEFLREELS